MKTFLIINILLLLFSACSYDNAFSQFDISPQRAKSEENIVSSKLYKNKEVAGVMSCVYLNNVNPQKYKDLEYFYIYMYVKETQTQITFTLNDTNASVTELSVNNEFTQLTDSSVSWQKYYLVTFEKQDADLRLTTKLGNTVSSVITFKKNRD